MSYRIQKCYWDKEDVSRENNIIFAQTHIIYKFFNSIYSNVPEDIFKTLFIF